MVTRRGVPQTKPRRSLWNRMSRRVAEMRVDPFLALLDVALMLGAYVGVLFFRHGGAVPQPDWQSLGKLLAFLALIHLASNWCWGLYGPLWRYASIHEAQLVLMAGATSLLAVLGVILLTGHSEMTAVFTVGCALTTLLIGAIRFRSRLFALQRRKESASGVPTAIIGAGATGAAIVRDMLRRPETARPVVILDDDPRTKGRSLMGVPVAGSIDDLEVVAPTFGVAQAVLAIPSASQELVRRAASAADAAGVALRVVPGPTETLSGPVSFHDVRDLRIDDLLGRRQVVTDLAAVARLLSGRRVLITGGGGSIGSEIARQVAEFEPSSLIILDHDETHLHDAAPGINGPVTQVLADVRDGEQIQAIFAQYRPEIVFHAAAHKHVPLLERHPTEAVRSNVLGTQNVVSAARACGVERFVFISTDKAVQPINVMGASKRLGELIVLNDNPVGTRFCAVRFGNVLGSRGSVVPTFARQVRAGGPLTVTDARMTRFFMTIREAVQLVLQAATLARGDEVFMLEMGQPVCILDLAHRMVRLAGRRPGIDVEIRITGRRPGEKLTEQLYAPEEQLEETAHPSILSLQPIRLEREILTRNVELLATLSDRHDEGAVAEALLAIAQGTLNAGGRTDNAQNAETAPVGLDEEIDLVEKIDLRKEIDLFDEIDLTRQKDPWIRTTS
jgi:FlaA1/EpsC-like NDP-sugar epimerase